MIRDQERWVQMDMVGEGRLGVGGIVLKVSSGDLSR